MNASWLRYLPGFLRTRLDGRHNLQVILSNTGWLLSDRVIRMGVGLLVGIWIARYLGPEQFGLLSYAMAIVALFGSVASLGLSGIVVRDLVKEPGIANVTLGTAFLLQIVGGFLAFALSLVVISLARPDDDLAKLMVVVLGFVMIFKATEVVKYWFESQVQSKYIVWVENGVFLIFAAVKVALILAKASLMTFVWATFCEGLLVAAGLLGGYVWHGSALSGWRIRYSRAKTLLKDSWPLMFSGLAVMVYMRIDQIMLGQMLGDEAVGIYTAAVRVSEVWYFIPMAIVASVFPSILEAKKRSDTLYYQRLQKLYDLMAMLSLTVAIFMTFLSGWIVIQFFGQAYIESGDVLAIHIWGGLIVALSAVHGRWLLAEGLMKYGLLYTVTGGCINVLLNLYLIPLAGVKGAAWATLCAYIAPVFIQLLLPRARKNFMLILVAFTAPYRVIVNNIKK